MLLPISDDNRGRLLTPVVVYTLVAINVLVFVFLQKFGSDAGAAFTYAYSTIPYEITHGVDLTTAVRVPGGMIPQAPGPSPIWLTLLSSMFMHGGIMHIAGNMLYLWIFGDNIEDNFGHVRFLVFYVLCGLVAAFAQIVVDPDSVVPSLGASGAIAGVLGAYLVMFPRNRIRALAFLGFIFTTVELPAIAVLGIWIVIQIISQYGAMAHTAQARGEGVAYMAHIGGFVAGIALSFLFRRHQPRRPKF